jgi:PPE-repeat protein
MDFAALPPEINSGRTYTGPQPCRPPTLMPTDPPSDPLELTRVK